MTYHLQNSAVMPREGIYALRKVEPDEFFETVIFADRNNCLKSWIGYHQNAQIIKKHSGVHVFINRGKTDIKKGDVLLCMTLKYIAEPKEKGYEVLESDFEYFICHYS